MDLYKQDVCWQYAEACDQQFFWGCHIFCSHPSGQLQLEGIVQDHLLTYSRVVHYNLHLSLLGSMDHNGCLISAEL